MASWWEEHEGHDSHSESSCHEVRSLIFAGPYRIAKVNDDGTYDLNDEHGTLFKYKVKERDLKPL
jgi:hypothetical protein